MARRVQTHIVAQGIAEAPSPEICIQRLLYHASKGTNAEMAYFYRVDWRRHTLHRYSIATASTCFDSDRLRPGTHKLHADQEVPLIPSSVLGRAVSHGEASSVGLPRQEDGEAMGELTHCIRVDHVPWYKAGLPPTRPPCLFFEGVDCLATGTFACSTALTLPVRGAGGFPIGAVQVVNKVDPSEIELTSSLKPFSIADEDYLERIAAPAAKHFPTEHLLSTAPEVVEMGALCEACVGGEPLDYIASIICKASRASAVVVWSRSSSEMLRRLTFYVSPALQQLCPRGSGESSWAKCQETDSAELVECVTANGEGVAGQSVLSGQTVVASSPEDWAKDWGKHRPNAAETGGLELSSLLCIPLRHEEVQGCLVLMRDARHYPDNPFLFADAGRLAGICRLMAMRLAKALIVAGETAKTENSDSSGVGPSDGSSVLVMRGRAASVLQQEALRKEECLSKKRTELIDFLRHVPSLAGLDETELWSFARVCRFQAHEHNAMVCEARESATTHYYHIWTH